MIYMGNKNPMKKFCRTKLPKFRLGAENFVRWKIFSAEILSDKVLQWDKIILWWMIWMKVSCPIKVRYVGWQRFLLHMCIGNFGAPSLIHNPVQVALKRPVGKSMVFSHIFISRWIICNWTLLLEDTDICLVIGILRNSVFFCY